ncbi:MAG: alpha/beta fold hydrolase [Flavisolibacter sp.]
MDKRKFSTLLVILACICNWSAISQMPYELLKEQARFTPVVPMYTMGSIKLPNGLKLEYAEKGQETEATVIFLHGYSDSWYSFEEVLSLLPDSIHAFSISQRGHGNSDRPAEGYKPEDFASDIADFMRSLKIKSAIIVGHSMGATVAQRFAFDFPEMTKALVLVASFASFQDKAGISELQGIISMLQDPIDSGFVSEFQKSTIFKPVNDNAFKTYVRESMKVPARVWKAIAAETLTVNLSKQLTAIQIPTLIIWGDKDIFCPKSDQELMGRSIRNSRLLIYAEIGHAIHWEDPQRFTKDLLEFINAIKAGNHA